eukprot:scaffold13449_cov188-Amphora_coffeaeformis.AAC.4
MKVLGKTPSLSVGVRKMPSLRCHEMIRVSSRNALQCLLLWRLIERRNGAVGVCLLPALLPTAMFTHHLFVSMPLADICVCLSPATFATPVLS